MKKRSSLRGKFVSTMLLVAGIIAACTLSIVAAISARTSAEHLAAVQRYIEEGIVSKGKVLTGNHALALRGLTLDNAFGDIRSLVDRAVKEDPEIVYGLYVDAGGEALAFTLRGAEGDGFATGKNAWRQLAIPPREVMALQPEAKRALRLGLDLLEVAVPIRGEEGEVIGTIRYGLSTSRMHVAIAKAKSEAEKSLMHSVALLGLLIGAATSLGLLLSGIQAGRITRPVESLTRAAQDLAAGKRSVHVDIQSGDELELLGSSFNRMVGELAASYGKLEELNLTLERKVEVRTAELAQKNRDMRLVFDNVDQGFATLALDGTMALERSRVLDRWFGECAAMMRFWDYIGRSSRAFGEYFQLGWEQMQQGLLPLEASLLQLPQRLFFDDRTFTFRYLPLHRNGQLEGVVVVIADISEHLAKERDELAQSELLQGIRRLLHDRAGFQLFLRETREAVDGISSRALDGDPIVLMRALHTLKGDAGSMGFSLLATLCHALEQELLETGATSDERLCELRERWASIAEHMATFGSDVDGRAIEISESDYAALLARLSAEGVSVELLQQLQDLQLDPIARPLARLAEQAKDLARRLGKGEINVDVQANAIRIDTDFIGPLLSQLVHVVRNAVDHGLETPEERARSGKPARGTIGLRALASADTLTLEIEDDGRGVDWDALARRAKEAGLPWQTHGDLIHVLCSDGVTTRTEVTSVSGRGVGMAAVRQRVEQMNGSIEVQSAHGTGTKFVLRVPVTSSFSSLSPSRRPRGSVRRSIVPISS